MDLTTRANLLGALRVGIGSALVVAPGFAGRIWVGGDADGPGTRVIARALGARDVYLGLRIIQSGQDGKGAGEWLRLGYLADVASLGATVVAGRNLTPWRRLAMPLIAGTVAALGAAVARAGKGAPTK